MKKLLSRGTYNSGSRPSEHRIGKTSFLTNNGGAIPPNALFVPYDEMIPDLIDVLPIANTRSDDPYQVFCRENGIVPHPARMPQKLAEFFIQFLTEPGDLVLDPFAGSNTTGAAAESLGRKWIGIEANTEYIRASRARFQGKVRQVRPQKLKQG